MRGIVSGCLIGLIAGLMGAPARGEGPPGITVVGSGTVKARPQVVEISGTVSGDAELAADAGVKVRDVKQRVADAVEAMKTVTVAVESRGFTVTPALDPNMLAQARIMPQQVIVQGGLVVQQPQAAMDLSRKTTVVEQVRVVIKDADKLELPKLAEAVLKTIDTAKASGCQFSQLSPTAFMTQAATAPAAPFILYRVTDASRYRTEACKEAIEDARKKATALAELSGNKIGRIVAVHDQEAMSRPSLTANAPASDGDGGLSSTVFGEIPVSVRLAVQFEVIR
jgi:uncharacterized protein YggE